MNKIRILFTTFLRIGAFTFGGGLAMLPLIHAEIVHKHKWMTDEEMMDMLIISESTPGVIAVNAATYIGYKIAGFLGALVATLGVILPSLCIILLISIFYAQFLAMEWVQYAFYGIRAAVVILIFNAVSKLYKKTKRTTISYILIAIAFVLAYVFKLGTIWIIVFGGLFGLLYFYITVKEEEQNG